MANRVSQPPNHAQNNDEIVDFRKVIQYFGSFKLGDDGNLQPPAAAAAQKYVSNSEKSKNQCNVVEEASGKSLFLPENSVLDNNGGSSSFWCHNLSTTTRGAQNVDYYFDLFKQESMAVKNSRKQSKMESLPSSTSAYVDVDVDVVDDDDDDSDPTFLDDLTPLPIFDDPTLSPPPFFDDPNLWHSIPLPNFNNPCLWPLQPFEDQNYEFGELHSGFEGYGSGRIKRSSAKGGSLFDFSLFQGILEGGDVMEINMLLLKLRGSYFELMTDKSCSVVFHKLISVCKHNQLDLVVADIFPCIISAAFCKIGAISVIKLIKRLKKSTHAITIVQILSTHFVALMTHEIAKLVIQNCFICFPNQYNKILYEKAILHCHELAIDKVGCITLNELMSTIGGEQRSRLLNNIADWSSYLANHQYGNYVVQNVLGLKNDGISARVVLGLRGQFVKLAGQPGGSHVVEKCMEASDFGIVSVVQEIVKTPKASLELSKNQFGNYVIQTALKKTTECGFSDLYESLVKSLEPYSKELNQSKGGKIVASLISDEFGVKWRSFSNKKDNGIWKIVANKERVV